MKSCAKYRKQNQINLQYVALKAHLVLVSIKSARLPFLVSWIIFHVSEIDQSKQGNQGNYYQNMPQYDRHTVWIKNVGSTKTKSSKFLIFFSFTVTNFYSDELFQACCFISEINVT